MTNNPVAEAITEYWGERCSVYEPNCPCCEAWAQYDAMTSTSAETGFWRDLADFTWNLKSGTHPAPMTVEAAAKVLLDNVTREGGMGLVYAAFDNAGCDWDDAEESLRALSGEKS